MRQIELTNGKMVLVDDEDYNYLVTFGNWRQSERYAACSKGKKTTILMHRLLMNPPQNMDIDHLDDNGLNNQKSNLRICTRSQNLQRNTKNGNTSSRFKGVCWDKKNKKWKVHIKTNGRQLHLGRFASEIEAAKRYDKAAHALYGEHADTNFGAISNEIRS